MRQTQLESLMVEMGIERQRMKSEVARRCNRESTTTSGRYLMRESVASFASWVDDWIANAQGGVGRNHHCLPMMTCIPSSTIALLTAQHIIDGISCSRRHHSICSSIGSRIEDEYRYTLFAESDKGMWMAMLRTAKKVKSYSKFRKYVEDWRVKCGASTVVWTSREKVRLGHLLLHGFIKCTGIIEAKTTYYMKRKQTNIQPTEETMDWIANSNEAHESLFPYYLPMLIPPAPWRGLVGGGYHSNLIHKTPLIKLRWSSSVTIDSLEGADLSEVLPAVNAVQDTAWRINEFVLNTMTHFYNNGRQVAGLPLNEKIEFPERPGPKASEDEIKTYKRDCGRINSENKINRAARMQLTRAFFVANKFKGERFWYPFSLDSRGRFYPIPMSSPLHPQGPSYAKALLTFADGKPIENEDQKRALAIHGANTWGEDKVSFERRENWVAENEDMILKVYEDPIDCTWWEDADDPWGFLAFCEAWGRLIEKGFGCVCSLPVAADGSNNGLQIYSLLLRDPVGAKATNVSESPQPMDIYQEVADLTTKDLTRMLTSIEYHSYPLRRTEKEAGFVATKEKESSLAAKWLQFVNGRVPRSATKRPVMTLPYGLKHYSALQYVAKWYRESVEEGQESPWGDSDAYLPCLWLGDLIWKNIGDSVVSARKAMSWLREVGSIFSDQDVPLRWTAPSGFPVVQSYPKTKFVQIANVIGDTVLKISHRSVDGTPNLNSTAMQNGLPPNFVHCLDAACTVKTINACVDEGINAFAMIHDSYATVAADAPTMQRITRGVYADVFSGNLLKELQNELQCLLPKDIIIPDPPEQGTLDPECVRTSPYFFQ